MSSECVQTNVISEEGGNVSKYIVNVRRRIVFEIKFFSTDRIRQ